MWAKEHVAATRHQEPDVQSISKVLRVDEIFFASCVHGIDSVLSLLSVEPRLKDRLVKAW